MAASSAHVENFDVEREFRRNLLLPVTATLLLLIMATVGGFYWYAEKQIDIQAQYRAEGVERLFRTEWKKDAALFANLVESVQETACVRDAYLAKERRRLLQCTEAVYQELRIRHRITHFYFHLPDKVNFLRVHHPARHGDLIQRFTLDQSVETGEPSMGLELGTFGTFTLRVVVPWRIDGRLVGYIEIGEEVEHFITRLKQVLELDLLLVIHKEFLSRHNWEEGQRMLAQHEDWDEYPDFVVIDRTSHLWLPQLHIRLDHHHETLHHGSTGFEIAADGRNYQVISLPLTDAAQRSVGHILSITDVTLSRQQLTRTAAYLLTISLLLAGLLWTVFLFFFRRYHSVVATANSARTRKLAELEEKNRDLLDRQETLIRERQQYQRITVEEQALGILQTLALQPLGLEDYLQQSLDQLMDSIPWLAHLPEGVIFLVREHDGEQQLELAAQHNFAPRLQELCQRVSFGKCLCGRVAAERKTLFCGGVDDRHEIHFDGMTPHGHYVMPLQQGGELLGVFNLYLPNGALHNEQDQLFLERVGEVLALGIACRRNQRAGKRSPSKGDSQ